MVKTKKQRVRKSFNYCVNRRRKGLTMKNRARPPVDPINDIKENWVKNKSAKHNFQQHGLIYNLNKAMNPKYQDEKDATHKQKIAVPDYVSKLTKTVEDKASVKHEQRLSPKTVELLSYYLDKYGEDYKGMARDVRNYNQETWKQIRKLITKFKNCSDQYAVYLKNREMLT